MFLVFNILGTFSVLLEIRNRQTHRQMRPNTLPRRIRGWYQFTVGDHLWKYLPKGPLVI